jgi:hypothetical protein
MHPSKQFNIMVRYGDMLQKRFFPRKKEKHPKTAESRETGSGVGGFVDTHTLPDLYRFEGVTWEYIPELSIRNDFYYV